MLISILLAILATFCVRARTSLAQDTTSKMMRSGYGVFGGVALNQHTANFVQLPGVPNCGSVFTNGFGAGPTLGAYYKYPVGQDWNIVLRGIYTSEGGTFNADEYLPLSVAGSLVQATDRHSIDVSIGAIALQPLVQYELLPRLVGYAGAEIGFVVSDHFDQIETLTNPSNGVFTENNLRTRNPQSGAIPNIKTINASLVIGAGYELPMNSSNSLKLIPQAYFDIGLTPVVSGISWRRNSFTMAAAVEYTPPYIPVVIAPPPPPPPPVPAPAAPPPIAARLKIYGVTDSGAEVNAVPVVVEELYEKNMSPLLPFVFFDSLSLSMPPRMHRITQHEAATFDLKSVSMSDALRVHTDMLNIVGYRLTSNPKTHIELTGIIHSPATERIAKERAEDIKNYFADIWKIDPKRIKVNTKQSVATSSDSDLVAEEHRVEIESDNPSLFDPLLTYDTIRTAEPPVLRIYPTVAIKGKLKNWSLVLTMQGREIASFTGRDTILPASIDWRIPRESIPTDPGDIAAALQVTDSLGRNDLSSTTIHVEHITLGKKRSTLVADRAIEKYNLIVFDRGTSQLTDHHKRLIEQIKKEIAPQSSVSITGYTDRVGEKGFNKKLSEDRARVVSEVVGFSGQTSVQGLGETQTLYSNSLPEGRFFCRTVVVTIETPEKNP